MSRESISCSDSGNEGNVSPFKSDKPAVYALTRHGAELAARVLKVMPGKLFVAAAANLPKNFAASLTVDCGDVLPEHPERFDKLAGLVARTFHEHPAHIFITACGIAVRTIAPHLVSKSVDPAVLVLDQNGEYVISLLSGHQGGANKLTEKLAAGLGSRPVITTASDCLDLPALDVLARDAGLKTADNTKFRAVMSAMVNGARLTIVDPENRLGLAGGHRPKCFDCRAELPEPTSANAPLPPTVYVGANTPPLRDNLACLIPSVLHIGVGCKRNTSAAAICEAIEKTLAANSLSPLAIHALSSLDAKLDEAGLIEAAALLNTRLIFFTPEELDGIPVTSHSPKALEQFNIPGVAEPCALASAGQNALLILKKQTFPGITIAIAIAANPKQKSPERQG